MGGKSKNLETLLRITDVVSLNLPLTKQTYRLIGRGELKLVRESGVLINTSRGQVVDEKALVNVLQTGKKARARLDVFEEEPPGMTIPS